MGYVFQTQDVAHYEAWLERSQHRSILEFKHRLMIELLQPVFGSTVLEVGCGLGLGLKVLSENGLDVIGIEPSRSMLEAAKRHTGGCAQLYRGYAENLPFDDNSFNYVCFLNSLEFVEDPQKALEEACRVAKNKLFIGILNRFALNGLRLRIQGMFTRTIYNYAEFFSIWELKQMLREIIGDVPMKWQSIGISQICSTRLPHWIKESNVTRSSPFGDYLGLAVTLVPRFRTLNLSLTCQSKQIPETATG